MNEQGQSLFTAEDAEEGIVNMLRVSSAYFAPSAANDFNFGIKI